MFNFLKNFKLKKQVDGFYCSDIFVSKVEMLLHDSKSFIYTCYFHDYSIKFEHVTYNSSSYVLGFSSLSYKHTVIYKEIQSLNLSGINARMSLKKHFEKLIDYANGLDKKHLNVILPFFKTEAALQTSSIQIGLTLTHPKGFIYIVNLRQAPSAKYNSFLNRTQHSDSNSFPIISYNDRVYDCLSPSDYRYLARLNQDRIYQIDDISNKIKKTLDDTTFTVHSYDNQYTHVFLNAADESTLFYGVINSQKEYYHSHLKEDDDFFNDISLHIFWMVNFKKRTTALNIFIYDDDKLIEEYGHSMDTKFEGDLIDLDYYSNFFHETLSKLVHCYYPNRKLIEFLNTELSIDEVEDRLTEDQYHLFKMITI